MRRGLVSGVVLVGVCVSVACGGDESDDLFTGGGTGGSSGKGDSSATGGSSGSAGSAGADGSAAGGAAGSGTAGGGGQAGSDGGIAGASAGGSAGATGGAAGAGGCADPIRYYADADKDGHGDPGSPLDSCTPPDNYVVSSDDCYDGNKDANPAQTAWFTDDRGDGSFDYDCDGDEVQQSTARGACQALAFCSATQGWQQQTAPGCGDPGKWVTGCGGVFPLCPATTEDRVQECH
jgi:hypothetical protein